MNAFALLFSAGGPLFAVGAGFAGAGVVAAITKPRPLDGCALIALGAAMVWMALALIGKGI